MVHSEVYLKKICIGLTDVALFLHVFSFKFFIHFSRGSRDPICPYVRAPMFTSRTIYRPTSCLCVFLCIFVFCYFAVPFIDWLYCTDLFRRIAASLFNKLTYFTDLSSTFSLLVHDAGQHQQTEYQA